jgi:hypothetical protein
LRRHSARTPDVSAFRDEGRIVHPASLPSGQRHIAIHAQAQSIRSRRGRRRQ